MQSWDSEGLWKKAKLFMDRANEHDQSSPEFAFFASLCVECLGRSALTKIHPVLNADPRDDSNILYACGYPSRSRARYRRILFSFGSKK
jgi:hypothetical protein